MKQLLSVIFKIIKACYMGEDLENYLSLKEKNKKLAANNLLYRKKLRESRKSHEATKLLVKKYKTVMTRKMEVVVMLKRTDYTDSEIAERCFCSQSYVRMVRSKHVK